MTHDTNTANIAETAALVAEQRHRLETWPELVAALESFVWWAHAFAGNIEDVPRRYDGLRCLDEARVALAKAKGQPT